MKNKKRIESDKNNWTIRQRTIGFTISRENIEGRQSSQEHCLPTRNAAKWKLAFLRSVEPTRPSPRTRCSLGFLHSSRPTFRQCRAVGGVHPIATILSSSMTPSGQFLPDRFQRFRFNVGRDSVDKWKKGNLDFPNI